MKLSYWRLTTMKEREKGCFVMKNEQIVLNQYPEGIPNDQTFKYENIDVQTPKMVSFKLNHYIFLLTRICEAE